MPLSRAPYTMLNIVVVRPMPSVSARTATALSAGLFRSDRAPYRRSLRTACMAVGVGVPRRTACPKRQFQPDRATLRCDAEEEGHPGNVLLVQRESSDVVVCFAIATLLSP